MHSAISDALLALPISTETPRSASYGIPKEFNVDPKTLRFSTHVRINTPGYGPISGSGSVMFDSDASRQAFESVSVDILANASMEKEGPWFYPADGDRSSYCHAHPDDYSSVMTVQQINEIVDGITACVGGPALRWVDVYEVFETVSDAEALRRVDFYENKIREGILSHHVTTRKTKFKSMDLLALVSRLPGMSFAGEKGWGGYQSFMPNVVRNKVFDIREDLVREGWLVPTELNGQTYYRTANKTEQRSRGLHRKQAA